ncbi:MAG: nitroreductase [Bacteroidales bacterium]|nr:nitroreductase [Bacteroidales bacterium]
MTLQEAILARHSVRQYIDKPIEEDKVQKLQSCIEECNRNGNLHMQLVLNEPKAFASGLAKYGKFSGISNYIAMVCRKGDDEKLGYYGEKVVLLAQTLGLNTCWVGLTFRKQPDQYQVLDGEVLWGVVALGYGATQGTPHPQKKGLEYYCQVEGAMPDWFRCGMEAALLAPTAINQQKFEFLLTNGNQVEAKTRFTLLNSYPKLDLGIAKCHFEIGAGKESFQWRVDS